MIGRARINLGGFIVGRIAKEGRTFEMLLAPDKAWEAKKIIREEINKRLMEGSKKSRVSAEELLKNPKISIELIFESFTVFEDLRRGKKATDGDMEAVFNTTDGRIIASHIILEGEIHWTQTQRDDERDKKSKYVGITEASKILSRSKQTIRTLITKGELKATKLGGKWHIERENL